MKKILLIITLIFLSTSPVFSAVYQENFSVISDIMSAFSVDEKPTIKTATDKYMQANISASWSDFYQIINDPNISELEQLELKEKMYELGFFSLADLTSDKIKDDVFKIYEKTVEEFYKPKFALTKEDELFLAEINSNIIYNNRAVEAVRELLQKEDLLKKSDYANYLLALGYYKTDNHKEAIKTINEAISINSKCENYKFLKIKLLAETEKRNEALKIFNSYNRKKNLPYSYRKKCELLKQFILYKTEKNEWERNYALGRYYYTNEEHQKALRSFQNASFTKNKKNLTKVWAMMSRTYLKMGEEKKAKDLALKAVKNDIKNKDANITLARIALKNNEDTAINYYKRAVKDDKLDTSIIKVAQLYEQNNEVEKAKKIYLSMIKKGDDEWESYYNLALLTGNKDYLIQSLKYNPMNKLCWQELINYEIGNKNYIKAELYLKNLLYIDDKDFKYYYYQGIISRDLGDNIKAKQYLNKCIKLNPDYYEARKTLTELKEYI